MVDNLDSNNDPDISEGRPEKPAIDTSPKGEAALIPKNPDARGDQETTTPKANLRVPSTARFEAIRTWWNTWRDKRRERERAKFTDKVVMVATAVIAVMAILQWLEMHGSSKQTDKIIATANQIECALITANRQNSDAVAKTLRQNQTQFDATLDQMKKQSAAMQHAGDLTAQQLELSERPWVDANIAIDGPLTFDVNGARIPLTITLRNTGHSPSLSTTIFPRAFVGSKSISAVKYRDQVCGEASREAIAYPQAGPTLFPNVSFERHETVYLTSEDIANGKASKENPNAHFGEVLISPSVLVCIAYRPTFSKSSVYDTAYIVDLVKLNTVNNGSPLIFDIGQTVDQQNLRLQLHIMDGAITAH